MSEGKEAITKVVEGRDAFCQQGHPPESIQKVGVARWVGQGQRRSRGTDDKMTARNASARRQGYQSYG